MMDWWSSLQTRERILVSIAAGLVIVALLYSLIWSPIVESRNSKKTRVENKQQTITWLMLKKQEVDHLKRVNPNLFNQVTDRRSLLSIVDTGAKQMGIKDSIRRIEPSGDDKVSIWMEEMNFDRLIVLLGELDRRNNILVGTANLSKSDQIGKVSGKLTLTR